MCHSNRCRLWGLSISGLNLYCGCSDLSGWCDSGCLKFGGLRLGSLRLGSLRSTCEFILFSAFTSTASAASTATARALLIKSLGLRCTFGR